MRTFILLALAACIALGNAQPVEKLPIMKPGPAEVLFRESEPFAIKCNTKSGDKVEYFWKKNNQPLDLKQRPDLLQRQSEGTLVFSNPNSDDEGVYQCHGKSEHGTASTRPISVKKTYLKAPKVVRQTIKPVEGRPFKMDCPIPDSYPKPEIRWFGQLIIDPTVTWAVADRRITVTPDGTIYFSNSTQEDTHDGSLYVCQAKSPAVDDYVTLAEYVIPELTADKEPKNSDVVTQYVNPDTTLYAGDLTYLYCIFGGTPLAHPDWFKEGKDINGQRGGRVTRYNRSTGKRLIIRQVLLEDAGNYKCVGDNEVGKPQSHSFRVSVVSVPTFTKKPEPHMTVKAGQDVTIPCEVAGAPAPTISWTYNGEPLASQTPVVIKSAQKAKAGYYGCLIKNAHGSDYAETLVHVV